MLTSGRRHLGRRFQQRTRPCFVGPNNLQSARFLGAGFASVTTIHPRIRLPVVRGMPTTWGAKTRGPSVGSVVDWSRRFWLWSESEYAKQRIGAGVQGPTHTRRRGRGPHARIKTSRSWIRRRRHKTTDRDIRGPLRDLATASEIIARSGLCRGQRGAHTTSSKTFRCGRRGEIIAALPGGNSHTPIRGGGARESKKLDYGPASILLSKRISQGRGARVSDWRIGKPVRTAIGKEFSLISSLSLREAGRAISMPWFPLAP